MYRQGIWTGLTARFILWYLLRHETPYPWPHVMGIFKQKNHWIVFDNTDHQCFVEDFNRWIHAIQYLTSDISPITLKLWDSDWDPMISKVVR